MCVFVAKKPKKRKGKARFPVLQVENKTVRALAKQIKALLIIDFFTPGLGFKWFGARVRVLVLRLFRVRFPLYVYVFVCAPYV